MLEYEKKLLLTEVEYISILRWQCKYLQMNTQTNYYFDDENLSMSKKGITCRIRGKNGIYKSTIKNHNTNLRDCSVEKDLGENIEFDPEAFSVLGLNYQGGLVTNRIEMYKDSNCKMFLDRNVYLGNVDFELEVEYSEGSEMKAQELIDYIAELLIGVECLKEKRDFLNRVNKDDCKSQRFFKLLKKY